MFHKMFLGAPQAILQNWQPCIIIICYAIFFLLLIIDSTNSLDLLQIVKRNEIMLEVTKDTITVPASFMFNMFNTLNHLRNGKWYHLKY